MLKKYLSFYGHKTDKKAALGDLRKRGSLYVGHFLMRCNFQIHRLTCARVVRNLSEVWFFERPKKLDFDGLWPLWTDISGFASISSGKRAAIWNKWYWATSKPNNERKTKTPCFWKRRLTNRVSPTATHCYVPPTTLRTLMLPCIHASTMTCSVCADISQSPTYWKWGEPKIGDQRSEVSPPQLFYFMWPCSFQWLQLQWALMPAVISRSEIDSCGSHFDTILWFTIKTGSKSNILPKILHIL